MTSTGYPQVGDRRAALDADRLTGVAMLRSTLSGLPTPGDLPTLDRLPTPDGPSVAPAPLALAAAGRSLHEPECRTTRAALHDYLARRLLPSRRRRVEAHLDGCGECTRAFIDVRQASEAGGTGAHLAGASSQPGPDADIPGGCHIPCAGVVSSS